jgi:hypothetical protein
MRNLKFRSRKGAYAALAVFVAALAVAGILIHGGFSSGDKPADVAHDPDPYAGLVRKVMDLDEGLGKGLSSQQMLEFASGIQQEIEANPLPDDDDLQFSGELIVKYLRELASIENYRRATLSKKGYDPLEPGGGQSNAGVIEEKKKYSTMLRQRTKQFRERLSQLR